VHGVLKKTPEEWQAEDRYDSVIVDSDGWRNPQDPLSWETPLSREEFLRRAQMSSQAPKKTLPADPDATEVYYHIRGANNRVRVVLRNAYAHMGHTNLMNVRLEIRYDTGLDTCDWMTVPGSLTGFMREPEAQRWGAELYRGGWRKILAETRDRDRERHPSFWGAYLQVEP
jgi:hypothetical protein